MAASEEAEVVHLNDTTPRGQVAIADFGRHANAGVVHEQIKPRPLWLQSLSECKPAVDVRRPAVKSPKI